MKIIYLLRHAKSSWKTEGMADFDRPLNKRGLKDAVDMGNRLWTKKLLPDCIVSSSSKRTRETLRLLAPEIRFDTKNIIWEDKLYLASRETILETVSGLNERCVSGMIVGHNPGITEAVNSLSGYFINDMPTAAIACVKFEVDKWSGIAGERGELMFYDYPKSESI